MTHINRYCADVGTANCPCPLAETGDCLICSRLAGSKECDCRWSGVCVYNEFIQNDKLIRNRRQDMKVPVLKKIRYGNDMMVLILGVSRGMALEAGQPGSFVFINHPDADPYANVPVSVMKADHAKGRLFLAVRIIGAKTRKIAEAENKLVLRGIYRSGLLGAGTAGLYDDVKPPEHGRKKWLIFTRGAGFAPAVNLLRWAGGRVDVCMVADSENAGREIIEDNLADHGESCRIALSSLDTAEQYNADDYDRIMIFASDYYIRKLSDKLAIPENKLVYSNNFHMCCGEGICGACGHISSGGQLSKMCKCREAEI